VRSRLAVVVLLAACAGAKRVPASEITEMPAWKNPDARFETQLDMGEALLEAGKPTAALQLVRQLREEGRKSAALDGLHARSLRAVGLDQDAQDVLERGIKRTPRDADLHAQLGILAMDSGDPATAIAHFRRATRLAPLDADAWNNLGFALMSDGRAHEALEPLREAVRLDGTRIRTRNNLGYALVAAGREKDAFRIFAATAGPAEAHFQVGVGLEMRGEPSAARQAYDEALSADPDHTQAQAALTRLRNPSPNPELP